MRLLGAVFAAALTLTLSPPAGAAASGDAPATAGSGAVTRSLPQGATACRSSQAKPSSAFAACAAPATATAASTATVSLPAGSAACRSTAAKPSTANAACAAPRQPAAAAAAALAVSLTASNPNLAPGGTTTLTATANQDVGPTPWFIEIFDLSTGAFLAECGFGTSCATSVTQSGSTFQDYVAYVSGFGTTFPPPNIQATSGIVVVSWMIIALTADQTALLPFRTATLTAFASLDVGPTPFYIEIFDTASGTFVADCAFGSTCTTSVSRQSGLSTYVAYISGFGTTFPPPNIRNQSAPVLVTWVSLGLGASPTSLPAGSSASITAASTLDVGPTLFWITIADQTTGTVVTVCGSGTFCSATVSQPDATTHVYIAYVAVFPNTLPPAGIRATSNTVSIQWTPVVTVTVPNLFDQFDSDAAGLLQSAGLTLGTDLPRVDCNELGNVDSQSVAAGSRVPPGTTVNITHGVAPAPPAECP